MDNFGAWHRILLAVGEGLRRSPVTCKLSRTWPQTNSRVGIFDDIQTVGARARCSFSNAPGQLSHRLGQAGQARGRVAHSSPRILVLPALPAKDLTLLQQTKATSTGFQHQALQFRLLRRQLRRTRREGLRTILNEAIHCIMPTKFPQHA